MAKVTINIQTPIGYMVARAVNNLQHAASDIARAESAAAMALAGTSGNNSLDVGTPVGTALFGGAAGTSADYAFALGNLNTQLITFVSNATAYLTTLDNGDVA